MAAHAVATPGAVPIHLLSFAAPLWLSGLLLLPVIRWLHRGGRHRRALPVSRVDLWQRAAASSPAAGERRPPDPAWRRRALLTALLFIALAQPQWPEPRTPVTLWIDDSLSMLTRETQGTRLAEGLAQARSLLAAIPHADVEVRTLGDPWRSLGALDGATASAVAAGVGRKVPTPPPDALLRRDRRHWLVTDGAHAALFDWPGNARPDRVVQAGRITRNVGLERLSARRDLDDPDRYDVLLRVANGGTAVETREVVIATEAHEFRRSTVRLAPGTSVLVNAVIPAAHSVRATLEPADALPEDDAVALDLRPLRRRRVAVDSACPGTLVAAIRAHPALAVVGGQARDADAALDCGTQGVGRDVATLRVRAERLPAALPGALLWSSAVSESRRIRLDPEALRTAARLHAAPGDEVLLAAGGEPLIVRRAGAPKVIETAIDFGAIERGRPELPLLADLMLEQLLDAPLLDEIAVADRGAGAANVVPSARATSSADADRPAFAGTLRDSTRALLAAALLVLVWEMIALARQWHRLRDFAGGSPS